MQIQIDWCDGLKDNREPKNYILEIGYDNETKYYFYELEQAKKYFEKYKITHHVTIYKIIEQDL